jgi:hypothetical protein
MGSGGIYGFWGVRDQKMKWVLRRPIRLRPNESLGGSHMTVCLSLLQILIT